MENVEEFRNKVVASDYVKEHYIKKQDLLDFIETELNMCNEQNEQLAELMSKDTVEGMVEVYKAIYCYIQSK